jgi:formylmethanofuran dehydrogenase subunit E
MQDYNAINQHADELDRAGHNIESLARVAQRQQQEILHLRAVVTGLIDALHAKGSFDDGELEQAVEQAYSELAPAAAPGTVTCSTCGRQVAAAQTDITASGPVCDACAAG